MDIWIAVSLDNAQRTVAAIKAFFHGAQLEGLSEAWLLDPENVSRFGAVPNLVEIVNAVSGCEFATAYSHRVTAEMDGVNANLISLEDLKHNKQASGRAKDIAGLENLP